MLNIAVYCRVSSEDQQERGTIENQIEFATKYCDLHQLPISVWYKDDGITGTLPLEERPAGQKLLQDAKDGKFDTLLVYKLDRLGRAARIVLNAVYELEQFSVKIKSMTEPFDTGDPSGRFLLTILAGVADLERSTIIERMWHGANRAARNGQWLGGITPFGYFVDEEKHLVVNETPLPDFEMSEADVIRLIYRLTTEQSMSTIKITDYLNALGVPPAYTIRGRKLSRGKRKENTAGIWRPGRVRNMIVNTTYMGLHRYGQRSSKKREIIQREVPAIVPSEVWHKAQEVLASNRLEALRCAKRQYLLRGLVKCACCGLNYHGTAYTGAKKQPTAYYVCNGKTVYKGPLQGKCPSKNIPAEWLEELVWQDCVNFITSPQSALAELTADLEEKKAQKANIVSEKLLLTRMIYEKESEKQSILDLFRKKLINSKDVEQQLQKIGIEKATLETRIDELENQLESDDSLIHRYDSAEELLTGLRDKLQDGNPPYAVKREIVKMLVSSVTVETKNAEGVKPQALLTVHYSFSKVVLHTDRDSLRLPT
jgi:site-specific DNA recombinase